MTAARFRRPTPLLPRGRSRAQSLVELAFVLPVLLLILLGMIDLGRAFVFGVAVQNGAREAARLGSRAAIDATVTDSAVLSRLIAASAPVPAECWTTPSSNPSASCVGTWTMSVSVDILNSDGSYGPHYTSLDTARANATTLSGARLTVTAQGSSLSMLAGMVTGMGLRLSAISAQGQAVMMVL